MKFKSSEFCGRQEKIAEGRANEILEIQEGYKNLELQVKELLLETRDQIQLDVEDLEKKGAKVHDLLSEEISTLVSTTKSALDEKIEADITEISNAMTKIEAAIDDFASKMKSAEELTRGPLSCFLMSKLKPGTISASNGRYKGRQRQQRIPPLCYGMTNIKRMQGSLHCGGKVRRLRSR